MRSRIIALLILLTALWATMLLRAAFLQLVPDERLGALRKRQFETVVTLRSRRGDVFDRKGQELAISTPTHSLFADPKLIEDPKQTARFLAKELKLSYRDLFSKIKNKKRRFVWIHRYLDSEKRALIEAKKIRGIGFIEEFKRVYPNERLLAHVLGFVGAEGSGLEGLEANYNEALEATRKKISIRRDARGRPLIVGGQLLSEAPTGSDIHLTIDRDLQYILEQELAGAVERHHADSATGVILDARTSEVLAMANAPAFDSNRPAEFAPDRRRNRAVTDAFEPGSTMKTFVIADALNRGLVEPNTKFDCEGGSMKVGGRVIREADAEHKFKMLTVTEILEHSSNIGTTKVAFKLGSARLREALLSFGFGTRAGIDLPGEAKGIVRSLPWRDHLLSNISFGHGVSATALQVANGYAAIANGGWLKRPYVVRKIHDYDSGKTVEIEPQTVRQVLRPEVAMTMKLMLTAVTGPGGTGGNARVAGYPVAGKTGTAQKVNPNGRGYLPRAYISSFAGFLPANDPRFVIYVAVDNPRKGYYGSQVAAPIFSKVASFAVRHAGLAPVMISERDFIPSQRVTKEGSPSRKSGRTPMNGSVNGVTNGSTRAAANRVALDSSNSGREARGAKVVDESGGAGRIPDLTGLTLREVIRRLDGSGLEIRVRGHGVVRRFSPPAGTAIAKRRTIRIDLRPESSEE